MNRIRRRLTALVTLMFAVPLLALPANGAAPTLATAATPAAAAPATAQEKVSLATATSGISDPVAATAPLRRDCLPGQIDLNKSTETAIGQALDINSKPTLRRIVEAREWLIPAHVISVPGVGPSKLERLRTATCATPVALPPTNRNHPKAGRGDNEVDLQVASIADVMSLGLARPVAERLIAARPLPDDLHQVAAPAVPGLSDSKIDDILSRGAVVTPVPFLYKGTNWRWVSHDHGAVVTDADDSRYALIVPAGRVVGDGAWATTTKLPAYLGGLPRADFHIHGPWTLEVVGQLPRPADATSESLIGWHDAEANRATGDQVSMYPNTWVGGDTARIPLTSLSEVTVDINPLVQTDPANPVTSCTQQVYSVFCPNGGTGWTLRDGSSAEVFSSKGAYLRSLGHFPTSGEVCGNGGPYVVSTGSLGGAAQCLDDPDSPNPVVSDTDAEFTIKNTSNITWFNSGIVLRPTKNGPGEMTIRQKPASAVGVATDAMTSWFADSGFLPPKHTMVLKVKRGAAPTSLTLAGANVTAAYFALAQVTVLGDILGIDAMSGCSVLGAATQEIIPLVTACLADEVEEIAKARAFNAPAGSKARIFFAGFAKKLAWLGVALTAWDAVTTALQFASAGPATSTYRYLYPASGNGASGSPSGDGTYIARTEAGEAFLVDSTENEAYEIKTAAMFNCLADSRFVVDLVELLQAGDQVSINVDGAPMVVERSLNCTPSPVKWDYRPMASGGNVPSGVIVKMPDWQGRGSWWVNAQGAIETIPNGGTYVCLAARAPVIYNFPLEKVNDWRPVGTQPASCP